MYTDLFLAIKDPGNPRAHPLLAALLYTFCPAAARWWVAGAEPGPVFDPVWQALSDRAGGGTLRDALAGYGFETLLGDVKRYVEQVGAFRRLHPGVSAPELLPTFDGGRLELARRFGLQQAIGRLGGRWENFFAYIRAWAYVLPDWEAGMGIADEATLTKSSVMLRLTGMRRPVRYPAWVWLDRVGRAARVVIGLITEGAAQDELRFALARCSGPEGEKPWPALPEVWAIDRRSGSAAASETRLPQDGLEAVVSRLGRLAREGPYPPLGALDGAGRCRLCGFNAQCYAGDEISPLALEF